MYNLLQEAPPIRVLNRNAGTPGTVKGTIVDMLGFNTADFIAAFQDVVNAAEITFRVAQSDVNDTATMVVSTAALAKVTADATSMDNKLLHIHVSGPTKRYLEIQVVIGVQNAPIDSIVCHRGTAGLIPVAPDATVVSSGTFVTPGAA